MTYSKVKENQASPRKLLKIILYGYMNGLYSSRDIEKACYRDINFMFLLEGSKAVTKNMQKLFTKYVNQQHILWQNVLVFLL